MKIMLFISLLSISVASQAMHKQLDNPHKTAKHDKRERASIRKVLERLNKSSGELKKEELFVKIHLLKQLRQHYNLPNECHTKQRRELRKQAKYLSFIFANPGVTPKMPGSKPSRPVEKQQQQYAASSVNNSRYGQLGYGPSYGYLPYMSGYPTTSRY